MGRVGWMSVAMVGVLCAPLAAQESNDGLKQELEQLRKEVDALKATQSSKEVQSDPGVKDPSSKEMMAAQDKKSFLETIFGETKLSGLVDTGYTLNPNRPAGAGAGPLTNPSGNGTNNFHVFTTQSNGFYLHNAQLTLERGATKEVIAGYKIELMAGQDIGVVNGNSNDFGIQEGYVQILAPVGQGLDLKIGKFATLAGYEVIESNLNLNYTRSIQFGFLPYTHTGVRGTYTFTQADAPTQVWATLGFNNGWDVTRDNNTGKTVEAQFAIKPAKEFTGYATLLYGAEEPGDADKRFLFDIVGELKIEKFTAALNIDIAKQDEANGASDDDASWFAIAGYAKYQFTDIFSGAIRVEQFNDSDAYRTGVFAGGVGFDSVKLTSVTLTGEARPTSFLIVRLEVRFDMADEDVFLDHSDADDAQTVLGAEAIIVF